MYGANSNVRLTSVVQNSSENIFSQSTYQRSSSSSSINPDANSSEEYFKNFSKSNHICKENLSRNGQNSLVCQKNCSIKITFIFQLTDSQLTNSDGSDSEDQIFAFDKAKNTVTLVASKSQVNF